jgi:hypothetical protein
MSHRSPRKKTAITAITGILINNINSCSVKLHGRYQGTINKGTKEIINKDRKE